MTFVKVRCFVWHLLLVFVPVIVASCPRNTAAQTCQRGSKFGPGVLVGYVTVSRQLLPTLRYRICHTAAPINTAIWTILHHTARELVISLASLNVASTSRMYFCSRWISATLLFRSRSLEARVVTWEMSSLRVIRARQCGPYAACFPVRVQFTRRPFLENDLGVWVLGGDRESKVRLTACRASMSPR